VAMLGSAVRYAALAGALAALSLLAVGCGSSKAPSVASVGATTTASTAGGSRTTAVSNAAGSSAPQSQTQLQQSALAYARCMRANGVPNFPDPSAGGGFTFQAGSGIDRSSPAFEAAQAKCLKLLPNGGPLSGGSTTHPDPGALAQMVKIAACMRRHGVPDFPEPSTKMPSSPPGNGVVSDIDGVILVFPSSEDMQTATFVRAAAACSFPLHNH
jgi:hypothetical protein